MSDTETGAGDFAPTPLADIFSRDEPTREEPAGGQPAPEPEPPAPTETGDPSPAAPPAAEPDPPHVPIAALKDERAKRQQIEAELTAMKARLAEIEKATPQQQQQPEREHVPNPAVDPVGYAEYLDRRATNREINAYLNASEREAKKKYPDLNEVISKFQAAASQDSGLREQLLAQDDPYDWAYNEMKRREALADIGPDPVAYRARVAEEERAKAMAEMHGKPPAAPALNTTPLPTSLAAARSVGARTVKETTGPLPLSEIVRFKG